MDEDLSHLSAEERTKYIKEREKKIKLIAVAKDRLEKLKADVEAVTIEDVGVLFEEGREAWEVEGDEGVAGRVDLREFFWRVSRVLFSPLPRFEKSDPLAFFPFLSSENSCLYRTSYNSRQRVPRSLELIQLTFLFLLRRDKIFSTLDNFDKPLAESTAKKMAVMMIDCLYAQVLKGSPPVGETPEAIAEELAVQKRIEVVSPFFVQISSLLPR